MDNKNAVLDTYRSHVNSGMARLSRLIGAELEERSAGSHVFDQNGGRYLDCGGYCVFLLGHCHPTVVARVREQLERNPLSARILINGELARAAETLAGVAPVGLEYVWFGNTGADAVEAALKIARLNGKCRLVAMEGGFHGKTFGALSVTGNSVYRSRFQPLLPDVEFIPYDDPGALENALYVHGEECCVILEPIQSEAGVLVPKEGYLKQVEELCRRYGAFLILDEISVGLGRIGYWWGAEREGVLPDVLLAGKALSGGVIPVSAAICTEQAYRFLNQDPMLHTSTFAGNPLAAVAARTTVEVIKHEGIVSRSNELGGKLLKIIRTTLENSCDNLVKEVRGLGLLLGIEFKDQGVAGEFFFELLGQHVIASHSLNAHSVVRITPPAVLDEEDIEWLSSALYESGRKLALRHPSSY